MGLLYLFTILLLPDCWLEVSVHPEGPAVGHLDTACLAPPLSLLKG
jgi:hypothetical protein